MTILENRRPYHRGLADVAGLRLGPLEGFIFPTELLSSNKRAFFSFVGSVGR